MSRSARIVVVVAALAVVAVGLLALLPHDHPQRGECLVCHHSGFSALEVPLASAEPQSFRFRNASEADPPKALSVVPRAPSSRGPPA